MTEDLEQGVARAETVLDEGRGLEALTRLREATHRAIG